MVLPIRYVQYGGQMNPTQPSLWRSLAIQGRVMHALLMREVITRYGRQNLGVLWVFVEPMIFTLGVTALWTAAGMNHGSSIPIVAFAVTGYSSVLLWRNCAGLSIGAIQSNIALLHHRNVRVIDAILVRCIIEITGVAASFSILSLLFIYFGWMNFPVDALQVFFGFFMLAWFGTALALVIAAATSFSHVVEKLWAPATYLLFPLSGAAFMADWLPPKFREIVLYLPMVHGVEILREGYFGNVVHTHYDVGYMAGICMVLTLFGLYLVREAGKRVGNL
jgi:capsular polysaccharide transport system permease protein